MELTAKRLREVLHYDPVTGHFTWLISINSRAVAGKRAGCVAEGYIRIGIDGESYFAHRLAWLYVHGSIPDVEIDHRNHDGHDNVFTNIRVATPSQNQHNKRLQRNNKSGFKGVSWSKSVNKWTAHIHYSKKQKNLGSFETAEEAHEFYCLAADLLHGEFANYGTSPTRRSTQCFQ